MSLRMIGFPFVRRRALPRLWMKLRKSLAFNKPRSLHESRTCEDKGGSSACNRRNSPIENREHMMNIAGRSRHHACPRSSPFDRYRRADQQPFGVRLGGAPQALAGAAALGGGNDI